MKRRYLIAYDIASPRRLGRVFRYLKSVSVPIQYSVFVGVFSHAELHQVLDRLRELIHPTKDDVRLYSLPEDTTEERMGAAAPLPSAVTLMLSTESGQTHLIR